MVDQCSNCDYYRIRPASDGTWPTPGEAGECRVVEPDLQGRKGFWPQVQPDDWCGEYDILGWNNPDNWVSNSVTLNTTVKTKILGNKIAGYDLLIVSGSATNTATNKGVMIKFYDGNTADMIGALSLSASASQPATFIPPLRAIVGEVWGQLDTGGNDVYIYLQGKRGRSHQMEATDAQS